MRNHDAAKPVVMLTVSVSIRNEKVVGLRRVDLGVEKQ